MPGVLSFSLHGIVIRHTALTVGKHEVWVAFDAVMLWSAGAHLAWWTRAHHSPMRVCDYVSMMYVCGLGLPGAPCHISRQ